MSRITSALKGFARRFPRIAGALRPTAHAVIGMANSSNVTWAKQWLGLDGRLQAQGENAQAALSMKEIEAIARLEQAANDTSAPGIGARASGRNVLMLVVSDLRIDPRVEREARALAAAGYHVTVICPDPTVGKDPSIGIDWGQGISIRLIEWQTSQFIMVRPGYEGGIMFDAALKIARELKPLVVHAHDLNTCLIGLAVSRQTGTHFVADFHEWTSENVHWDGASQTWQPYPADWKAELQALERRVMREASAVITVCDSIAEAIAQELGDDRTLQVIRNMPALSLNPTKNYLPLKQQLGLPEDQFVLLWQGGTGPTRLIEPIIEALAFAPRCVLAVRGPSLDLFGPGYRAIAEKVGASDRLLLLDPVPSVDVVAAARGADAGIWTLPRLCRNFTYALPNKIFEYTASNLALLVAAYPEARRMVETHRIGLTFEPYDPRSIAAAINRLIDEPNLAEEFRRNTQASLAALDAQGEWQKLVAVYEALPRIVAQAHSTPNKPGAIGTSA